MNDTVKVGRERKVRCHSCGTTRPESEMESVWLSADVVVQACKEHGLTGYKQPAAPPTVEEELRARIQVLENMLGLVGNKWRDNEEERRRMFLELEGRDPTVGELEELLKIQTRAVECAIAFLDNDLYATRVAAARGYLEEALEETKDIYGIEASL